MRLIFVLLCILFSFSSILLAEDFGPKIVVESSGLLDDDMDKTYKDIKGTSEFLPGLEGDEYIGPKTKETTSFSLPGMHGNPMDVDKKKYIKDVDHTSLGSMDDKNYFLEYKIGELIGEIENKGRSAMTFNYFKDTYDYEDSESVFDRTYRQDSRSHNIGTIQLGYDWFISRKYGDFSTGLNLGYGYNSGYGIFQTTKVRSKAEFKLITLPLDVSVKYASVIGRWFKIELSAGPSVMGLYQTRSDRDSGERGKRRRQIGTGYFGQGALKFSLSDLSPRDFYKLFDSFSITKVWFGVLARYQYFSNFQDDITISGNSLGIGLSFEYL